MEQLQNSADRINTNTGSIVDFLNAIASELSESQPSDLVTHRAVSDSSPQ